MILENNQPKNEPNFSWCRRRREESLTVMFYRSHLFRRTMRFQIVGASLPSLPSVQSLPRTIARAYRASLSAIAWRRRMCADACRSSVPISVISGKKHFFAQSKPNLKQPLTNIKSTT
jgi:hypothetical protein